MGFPAWNIRQIDFSRRTGKILWDAAEAEDLVQDVFLYIYRKCGLYDASKGPARSWQIQIAICKPCSEEGDWNSMVLSSSKDQRATSSGEQLLFAYLRVNSNHP